MYCHRIVGKEKLIQLLEQFVGKEHGMYSSRELYSIHVYAASEEGKELYFAEMDGRGIVKQNGYEYLQSYISLLHAMDGRITLYKEIRLQGALASLQGE